MFVLDSCAISEIAKPVRNPGFWSWLKQTDQKQMRVTIITITESFYGVERMPAGKRRDHVKLAIASYFDSFPVLELTREAAKLTGALLAAREREGRAMQFADASIAAIALYHNATLVTRDAHFTGIATLDGFEEFKLLNPWSP